MDFYHIKERVARSGAVEVYPDFRVTRSKDLMIRGNAFYAIWDEAAGLWSTDEYDVQRLVDQELYAYAEEVRTRTAAPVIPLVMSSYATKTWVTFRNYLKNLSDNHHELDELITFANTPVTKEDYVSKRLPYPLAAGDISAYEEIASTLYEEEEREKFEWAMGAIISGESKLIQKFLVFYGSAGTGKSTIMNIQQGMFAGYYTTFEAKSLVGNSNSFATEVFKGNPLVAFQHDGDLSRIEDNSKLNSIVSHEDMTMNEKFKASYTARINAFLIMGTNKPVKITDAKSGIIRRLIDVRPSGEKIPEERYHQLMSRVPFEYGAIAAHCLNVYQELGRDYYSGYRPLEMMLQTDVFFNYVEAHYDIFKDGPGISLDRAYALYKQYCEDSLVEYKLAKYRFREELRNYFHEFHERIVMEDGTRVRSWYTGFINDRFKTQVVTEGGSDILELTETVSLLDEMLADAPAQLSTSEGTPTKRWVEVTTQLKDIDTSVEHYVRIPENHIVIDFDIRDSDGNKSAELNLAAASLWPATYAEYSKSGGGIHLHYIYGGDPTELAREFGPGVEIKVYTGFASLRRRLSYCNSVPVATINGGLPIKEKKVINQDTVKSEKGLRALIVQNLQKKHHPGTKPSIDFIYKILEDAYASGMVYDVSDMRGDIFAFANGSTNQALYCLKLVQKMKFASEKETAEVTSTDDRLVVFDTEVYPNLFVVSWKYHGAPEDTVVSLINPTAEDIELLLNLRLVGFNNRKYDNHILYARYMGYDNESLYKLSKRIIEERVGFFREAYGLSWADIYDFSSKKQGLKKFQIEYGLPHKEMDIPWDQPVPDDRVADVVEYCENDVNSTDKVLEFRWQDYVARQILAEISGLPVNDSTQQHTAQIVFEGERNPQAEFEYTDLSEMFEGYTYSFGKSEYRGEDPSEGGYVYAEPGMYSNVALLDVESMHPSSIRALNAFGPYTKNYNELVEARLAIKHKDFDKARSLLNGKLAPYLGDEKTSKELSYALKIVINIVYGLTSAKFSNAFKDPRNEDNIVAKRGALFMIDLKHFVQEQGYSVAHIKTDSIKIPDADENIIGAVFEFGQKYGYNFEHEKTYEKLVLVNKAVYVAAYRDYPDDWRDGDELPELKWTATGAQFIHPYVFKTLFSKEEITFDDLCETKAVTSALYLEFEQDDPAYSTDPHFVGKVGRFVPILPGHGGGLLLREKGGKYYSATGTKGYTWMEADVCKALGKEDSIDMSYFENLVAEARTDISAFGDSSWFIP